MIKLISDIISRYYESFIYTIPEVTSDWFILTKVAFYFAAIFIYILTFLVLMVVVLIIQVIATPVSFLYRHYF